MEYSFKAVLFDFDGVVVDTESQYTIFWDEINEKYLPEVENLALKLKGNTLVEVFEKYFPCFLHKYVATWLGRKRQSG